MSRKSVRTFARTDTRRRTPAPRRTLRVENLEARIQPADAPLQFFYLPYPEAPMRTAMAALGGAGISTDVVSITSIVASTDNTVLYYDQWEGTAAGDTGFEADLANPVQPSTQVWGDNNPANGLPPGYALDLINAGDIITLQNTVPATPRVPGNFFFDGGDKIGSSQTIAVSRANWPVNPGALLADASEVYDTRFYGTQFTAPVGEDVVDGVPDAFGNPDPVNLQVFEFSSFFVMASQDGTTVSIDHDGDGTPDDNAFLNQGDWYASPAGAALRAGGTVTADKPIQVHLVTGDVEATYESRYFALIPDAKLANDYYSPVGSLNAVDLYNLFVHNPNNAAITVHMEDTAGTTVLTVAPHATVRHIVNTQNSATHVFAPGGEKFAVVGAMDIDTTAGGSQARDWGLTLQPTAGLSPVAVVAWAPGNDGTSGTENGSPIWVTVEKTTRVYVDFDGDPSGGPQQDPLGNFYDIHLDVPRLALVRIFDTINNDLDQARTRVYTADGTLLSAAWGQDPLTASPAAPAIDAGYAVPAFPTPQMEKTVAFAPGGDANGDGRFNTGDTLRYSIRIINQSLYPILNSVVVDALPGEVTYVPGTTTLDDGTTVTPIADDPTGTPFPMDDERPAFPNPGTMIGNIPVGASPVLSFDIVIDPGLASGTVALVNAAELRIGLVLVRDVLSSPVIGAIGDLVWADGDADGTRDVGEPGIPNVTLDLYSDANGDGSINGPDAVVGTATTDANGRYQFIDRAEGNYIVRLTDTNNVLATATPTTGGPLVPVPLGAAQVFATADYGFQLGTPDLVVIKSDGGVTATTGGTISYTLTVQNAGTVDATGVVVTETVPANTTFNAVASDAGWNAAGTSFAVGALAAGASRTITYAVTVSNSVPAGLTQVANAASAADDGTRGPDPTPLNNTGNDTTPVNAAPDLSVTKDDGGATATPGGTIAYTLTIQNLGNQDATGVTVTETVPANTTFNAGASEVGWNAGGTSFTIASLTAGATRTITYAVTVNGTVPAGLTQVDNTATVADDGTNGPDPTPLDNTGSDTTPVAAAPDLAVTKTDGGATTSPGGVVTYTLTIQNLGTQDATGVVVTETVPANTTFNAVASTVGWNAAGTSFAVGDLAAGASVAVTYAVTVAGTVPAGFTQVANSASVADDGANGPDPTPANNTGDDTTPVNAAPDLAITKSDGGATVSPGGVVTYTLTIQNLGIQDATGVVVTETVPANTTFSTGDSTVGWNAGGTSFTVGNLAAGGSTTVSYAVTVGFPLPAGTTEVANTATVADDGANGADPTPVDNTDSDTTPIVGGSVGNLVWLDLDADGTADAGEPGIAGVQVVLTWFGPDGNPGGGDDTTTSTTTDGTGAYSFTNLPVGNFQVDVVPATLPEPLAPTFDLDGTATPHGTARTLTAGEAAIDLNFGYRGTAMLGDRVWYDFNTDGQQDAGEPGIVGVGVGLIWAGPDGAFGTGDEENFGTQTAADGAYGFSNLPAGSYRVFLNPASMPAGLSPTNDPDGPATPGSAIVDLTSGQQRADADFGYAGARTVGDRVWFDADGDGTPDAGEPGLVGAAVQLTFAGLDGSFGTADDITRTTTTAADGAYSFTNLPEGSFQVRVTAGLPAGVAPTFDRDDAAPTLDGVANITVGAADRTDVDFGYAGSLRVGDAVWFDADGDGTQDAGEPGLHDIDVTLTFAGADGAFATADDLTFTDRTDAAGVFGFDRLPQGQYRLVVDVADLPGGMVPTFDADGTGTPGATSLTLAADDLGQDFGFAGTGSVGDRVWNDADGGGDQDPAETGLNGVTVRLTWAGQDGLFGTADDYSLAATTAGDGNFQFARLPAGSFRVAVDPATVPAGAVPTFDPDGTRDHQTAVTLGAGEARTDLDFGYNSVGSIAGQVYLDQNLSGTFDGAEAGIVGVRILLSGRTQAGANVTREVPTAADGTFLLSGLQPGTYRITEVQPAGYLDKDETVGGLPGQTIGTLDGNDAIRDIVVGAGQNLTGYHFGDLLPAAIRGFVYIDLDNNGQKADVGINGGEPVMRGVIVRIDGTNDRGQRVTLNVQTNELGLYAFDGLRPGTYTVTEVQPKTALDGRDTLGTPAFGANAATNDRFSGFVLAAGDVSTGNNFGELPLSTRLDGWVYVDRNGNGQRDAGEPGIPGVGVWLTGTDDLGRAVRKSVVTNAAGRYIFLQVRPGTYNLTEAHPSLYLDGRDVAGTLGGVAGNDVVRGIVLRAGQVGTNYNFGERGLSPTAVSKRMLLMGTLSAPTPGSGLTRVTAPGAGAGVVFP